MATWLSLSTLSATTSEYMQDWWKGGFVPAPWRGLHELLWIPSRLGTALGFYATGFHPPLQTWTQIAIVGLFVSILPLGFVYLFRRKRSTAVVLVGPIVVAVSAAAIRLLPLAGRVSLFLAPVLLLVWMSGLDQIRAWIVPRLRGASHVATLGLAVLPTVAGFARNPPPIVQGGTRPVLEEVKAHWLPGDRLVVARGMWTYELVNYYGALLGLERWTPLDRLEGDFTANEILRSYLKRIDAYRGWPRIWFHLEGTKSCEDEAILGYLNAIGRRLHTVQAHLEWGHRISGHLYDLSDPALLASTNSDSYPLPDCGGELGRS
jgi:hypothetical protein